MFRGHNRNRAGDVLRTVANHGSGLRTCLLITDKQRHNGVLELADKGLLRRVRPTGGIAHKSHFHESIRSVCRTTADRIGAYIIEAVPLHDDAVAVALRGGEYKVGVLDLRRLLYAIVGLQSERVESPYIQLLFAYGERIVVLGSGGEYAGAVDKDLQACGTLKPTEVGIDGGRAGEPHFGYASQVERHKATVGITALKRLGGGCFLIRFDTRTGDGQDKSLWIVVRAEVGACVPYQALRRAVCGQCEVARVKRLGGSQRQGLDGKGVLAAHGYELEMRCAVRLHLACRAVGDKDVHLSVPWEARLQLVEIERVQLGIRVNGVAHFQGVVLPIKCHSLVGVASAGFDPCVREGGLRIRHVGYLLELPIAVVPIDVVTVCVRDVRPRECDAALPDRLRVKGKAHWNPACSPENRVCRDVLLGIWVLNGVNITPWVVIHGTSRILVGAGYNIGRTPDVDVATGAVVIERYRCHISPWVACPITIHRAADYLVYLAVACSLPPDVKSAHSLHRFHRDRYLRRAHKHNFTGIYWSLHCYCTVVQQTFQIGDTIIRSPHNDTFLIGDLRLPVNRVNHCGIPCVCNQFEVRAVLHIERPRRLVRPACRPPERNNRVVLPEHNDFRLGGIDIYGGGVCCTGIGVGCRECDGSPRRIDAQCVRVCVPYNAQPARAAEYSRAVLHHFAVDRVVMVHRRFFIERAHREQLAVGCACGECYSRVRQVGKSE